MPELKENPLVKRVVDVFDDDLSGEVDFKGKRTFTLIEASSNHILKATIFRSHNIIEEWN